MRMNWSDEVILVTGGTGSFGRKFVEIMLNEYCPRKLIVFSRDELKQHEMRAAGLDHPSLRYLLGDVRDAQGLERALSNVTVVVHTAALKQVPACEHNPFEAVQTNIIGSKNVIDAAINRGVRRVIALSTARQSTPSTSMARPSCARKKCLSSPMSRRMLRKRASAVCDPAIFWAAAAVSSRSSPSSGNGERSPSLTPA